MNEMKSSMASLDGTILRHRHDRTLLVGIDPIAFVSVYKNQFGKDSIVCRSVHERWNPCWIGWIYLRQRRTIGEREDVSRKKRKK